jgi:hypothetical protein
MAEENNNNVGEIAGSIKAGLSPTRGMTRTSTSTVASLSSSFQSNISQNQQGFDDLIESNASFSSSVESFAETLKKVSEMNRKEFNDQRTALVKAIEEMKQAGGEDNKELVEKLTEGLQDKAMGTEGGRLRSMYDTGMSKMKEASNVDQDAGFVEGMKQAFSPERMFPKLFGKDFQASQATTGVKVKGSIGFGSGVDRETPAEKQTELLQDILESLHRIEGNGGMAGGGGGLGLPSRKPNLRPGKNPPKTTPKATPQTKAPPKPPVQPPKPPVQPPKPSLAQKAGDGGKKLLSNAKGLGKGLARGAKFIPGVGLLAAAGMGVYDGIQGAGNAAETFGLEEGEEASFGQKAAGAAGGVLSGLTFGLADGDKMAKGLYGFFGGDDDSPEEMQKRGMEIPRQGQTADSSGIMIDKDGNITNEDIAMAGVEAEDVQKYVDEGMDERDAIRQANMDQSFGKRGKTIGSATDSANLSEKGAAAVANLKGDGVPEVNPETGKRGKVIGSAVSNNSAKNVDMDAYGKAFDQIKEKEAELEAIGDLSGAGQREMNSPEFKEKRERQKALKAEIAQLFKEMDAAMGETPEKEAAFDALLDADDDDFYAETPVKGNAKVTTTRTETGGGSITTFADKKVDTEESKALRAEAESVEGQKDALIQQMKDSGLQGGALLDAMMDSPEYQDLQLKVKQLKAAAEAAMGSLPQDPIIEAGKNVSSTIVEGATADAAQGQAPTIINNNQSAPPAAPQKQAPVIVTTPIGVRNNDSSARDNASRVW